LRPFGNFSINPRAFASRMRSTQRRRPSSRAARDAGCSGVPRGRPACRWHRARFGARGRRQGLPERLRAPQKNFMGLYITRVAPGRMRVALSEVFVAQVPMRVIPQPTRIASGGMIPFFLPPRGTLKCPRRRIGGIGGLRA
jgi:hypothetical protein